MNTKNLNIPASMRCTDQLLYAIDEYRRELIIRQTDKPLAHETGRMSYADLMMQSLSGSIDALKSPHKCAAPIEMHFPGLDTPATMRCTLDLIHRVEDYRRELITREPDPQIKHQIARMSYSGLAMRSIIESIGQQRRRDSSRRVRAAAGKK